MKNNMTDNLKVLSVINLIRSEEKTLLSERMSTRMVECAAAMDESEFIGWQMIVPQKGKVDISLFGSSAITNTDLQWMIEKCAISKSSCSLKPIPSNHSQLYELYLPIAEKCSCISNIGFNCQSDIQKYDLMNKWPQYFASNYKELIRILQVTGASLRCTIGSATQSEQANCFKNTLKSFASSNIDATTYIGHPIKIRVILFLPCSPSIRLKAILEEAIPGIALKYLGDNNTTAAQESIEDPMMYAPILPDYAARILILEPKLTKSIIGIETSIRKVKAIPSTHKNTKSKYAVKIGKALDVTGCYRNISIGELDLRRHYQIVGQTGTGKSTLIASIVLNAITQENGYGLTFFDPHGTTIDTILRSVDPKFSNRIRVIRIGDEINHIPLGMWDSDSPELEERNISDLCELFQNIFDPKNDGIVGPRYQSFLTTFSKAAIALLGQKASMESIQVLAKSKDNMLKLSDAIKKDYPDLSETIKNEYLKDDSQYFNLNLGWYLSKLDAFTSTSQMRETLGAGTNALNFNHSIDTNTVTLIDLASPSIGTRAARMIGTVLLMKLWNAAVQRKDRNRTHIVLVDEASLFQTNPMPRMLAESRKFGIACVLCHQHTGQLTYEIREALEANSANFSAFRLSPRDAAQAAIRFDDANMAVSLTRLDAFNAVTTLSVDGIQTSPFTLKITRPKEKENGCETAKHIEAESINTLINPFKKHRALTKAEIQSILDQAYRKATTHDVKLCDEKSPFLQGWESYKNAHKKVS